MERLVKKSAQGYIYQPGDGTKYFAVVTGVMGYAQVAIMNESFSDVITINADGRWQSTRGQGEDGTNPWTVKAARELIEEWRAEEG